MRIILFDIDETLLSCQRANAKTSEAVFKNIYNIDANEGMINNAGKTEKGIIEEVVRLVKHLSPEKEVEVPNAAYQVWAETSYQNLKKYPPIILPGVKYLLEKLSKDPNIIIGLLTGNSRLRAESKLKQQDLRTFLSTKRE